MSDSSRLEGKVAKILTSTKLVINIGSNKGVKCGMIFDVIVPKGQEIRDPDTDELLGSIDRPKIQVKIEDVWEKFSVAKTFKKTHINIGGQGMDTTRLSSLAGIGTFNSFSKLMRPPKYIEKVQTFKTNEETWEDLDEKDSLVKIGDIVRLSPQ